MTAQASRRRGLSKSKLLSWLQCPKKLWLEVHKPQVATASLEHQHLFAIGHSVGEVAQRLHPEGVLIRSQDDLSAALAETQHHIEAGTKILFEPTFQRDGLLVRVDILSKREGAYDMREVKASASVQDYHLSDVAIQAWVLEGAGIPLRSVMVQHVDTSFTYPGRGEYAGLFRFKDVGSEIRPVSKEVSKWLTGAQQTLASSEPERRTGRHCSTPFECANFAYCSGQEGPSPEYPLGVLPYAAKLLPKLVEEGYRDVRDIPEGRLSNEVQERVRRVTSSGIPELATEAASFLTRLPYPRYYFDFETIGFAVPVWAGTRPYQQIPFQWSCHIEGPDGALEHRAYLNLTGSNPVRDLASTMVKALGTTGPILAYAAGFEKGCIEDLARMVPDLGPELLSTKERFVDLLELTRKSYYHPQMRGSWSLKAVLPTIAPELDYANLGLVRHGGDAQQSYLEAISDRVTPERRVELQGALEKYCERDTLALVRLSRFLEGRERVRTARGAEV